jgi:hypothetical protein
MMNDFDMSNIKLMSHKKYAELDNKCAASKEYSL